MYTFENRKEKERDIIKKMSEIGKQKSDVLEVKRYARDLKKAINEPDLIKIKNPKK